jgi:hypothetical protein
MGRFLPSLVVLLLLPMVACAEIYSFRDRNGVINLSDRPPQSGSFRTLSRNQSGEWGIQQVHRNLVGRGGYSIRHQLDRYQIHPDGIGVTADRDGRYRQSVASSASRHGVDHRLLDAVIAVESSYDRWVTPSIRNRISMVAPVICGACSTSLVGSIWRWRPIMPVRVQ